MIKEIVQYIEDNTDFIIGTDLFAGFAPPEIEDCVIAIESGGRPNFYLTDYVEKTIQIVARNKDYWKARDDADEIYVLLHGQGGITLPKVGNGKEYYVNTMEAISVPQSVGQDEKGLFNISTNFVLRIQDA